MRSAVALVPDDAAVTSSYDIGPHLSQREQSYDWPNPFWPAYWAGWTPTSTDCTRFPSASVVQYLVLDMNLFPEGDPQRDFIESLIAPGGEFSVVRWRQDIDDNVLVARRVKPGPDGEAQPPNCPGTNPFTPPAAGYAQPVGEAWRVRTADANGLLANHPGRWRTMRGGPSARSSPLASAWRHVVIPLKT